MTMQVKRALLDDEGDWKRQVMSLQDAVCHLLKRNEELRHAVRALSAERSHAEYPAGGRATL